MTRIRPPLLIGVVAVALLGGACGSSGAGSSPNPSASGETSGATLGAIELVGTSWTLVDIDGIVPANAGRGVTLEFRADGRAGGTAGCNTYNGSYTVDGAGISFGPLISTKMACEQPLMTLETTYLAGLQAATTYGMDGSGNLVLQGTATLTFSPG